MKPNEGKTEDQDDDEVGRLRGRECSPVIRHVPRGVGAGQAELLQRIKLDLPIDDLLQQMPAANKNGAPALTKPSSENGNESGPMKPNEA